jgi:hypothetical protein
VRRRFVNATPRAICALALGTALLAGGCSFGPRALEQSHGRYQEAVRRVEEEQFLRNLVHLRYNEGPLDLDINSLTTQFELAAQAEARPFSTSQADSGMFRNFSRVLPDVMASAANRPTLSFSLRDDGTTVRRFLTPISAETLVFLTQTSWPVSTVVRLWVERFNGVPNAVNTSGPRLDDVPTDFARFLRIAELLQVVQDRQLATIRTEENETDKSGPLPAEAVTAAAAVEAARSGMEYRRRSDGKTWVLVRKESRLVLEIIPGAESAPEMMELARLLNLKPGQRRYPLVVTTTPLPDPLTHPRPPSTELHVTPRSTSQVAFFLTNGVEVPPEHLAAGLVRLPVDAEGQPFDSRELTRGLFEVHVCKGHKAPARAFVAVKYRGYWYYLEDSDLRSKATLSLMLQLERLDFKRQQLAGPALTLPVGR